MRDREEAVDREPVVTHSYRSGVSPVVTKVRGPEGRGDCSARAVTGKNRFIMNFEVRIEAEAEPGAIMVSNVCDSRRFLI